jgi:hypothetical protein
VTRYLVLFVVLVAIGLAMMAAILAQYGYSLFDPEMRMMVAVAVAVAAYVAWRISTLLKNRRNDLSGRPAPGGAGQGKLAGLFAPKKSAAHEAREASLEARRRKLIEEGKLEPEEAPPPPPPPAAEGEKPTRVAADAPIKDRMAARAERVRLAKEQGKI